MSATILKNQVGGVTLAQRVETEGPEQTIESLKKACSARQVSVVLVNLPYKEAKQVAAQILDKTMILIDSEAIVSSIVPYTGSDKVIDVDKVEAVASRLAMGMMLDALYNYREIKQIVIIFDENRKTKSFQGTTLVETPQLEAWADAVRRAGISSTKMAILTSNERCEANQLEYHFGMISVFHV
jgi:hypothetical protein